MSLTLEPSNELAFKRPFTNGHTAILRLHNTSTTTHAFKVKTTAPKQYCVRPNCGNLKPQETIDVSVILQPMRTDPPLDFKCKDKFLVQCVQIDDNQVDVPATELWAHVDAERKNAIVEHRLRCSYSEESLTSAIPPDSAPPLTASTSVHSFRDGSPNLSNGMTALTSPSSGNQVYSGAQSSTARSISSELTIEPMRINAPEVRSNDPDRMKSLQATITQLEHDLAAKTKLVNSLQSSELRKRGNSNAPTTNNVVTRTIVDPNSYAPRQVLIIGIVAFILGALIF